MRPTPCLPASALSSATSSAPSSSCSARHAVAKSSTTSSGVAPAASRRCGPRVGVFGRRVPGIFEHAGFDRAAPQVRVDRIRLLGRMRDRDAVFAREGDRIGPRERLLAQRRAAGQRRVERAHRELDAHLIVAFAGAAVRDGVGAVLCARSRRAVARSADAKAPPRADRRLDRARLRAAPGTHTRSMKRSRASISTASYAPSSSALARTASSAAVRACAGDARRSRRGRRSSRRPRGLRESASSGAPTCRVRRSMRGRFVLMPPLCAFQVERSVA